MARKQSENYLDFVPTHNPAHAWDAEDGLVTVHMTHKGFYHKIAQVVFRRPRVSHIALERYGSFLWLRIDGARTVGQLAECMKEQFGADAEPLYPRVVKYVHILYNNRLILFVKKGGERR